MSEPSDLELRFDWQPADQGVRAPELRATFAQLEVRVGQDCVTLVADSATGSVRRSVLVSLYPLAEWIVFNWWRLQYNGRTGPASRRSQSLSSAGDGFCWPDLRVSPEGTIFRMHWRRRGAVTGWPVDFLAQGSGWGRRDQIVPAFDNLVEAVLTRLEEAGLPGTVLAEEWAALRSLDPDEIEFCRAVARLGVDPLGDGVNLADAVNDAWSAFGENLALELLDGAAVPELAADIAWLSTVLEEVEARQATMSPALSTASAEVARIAEITSNVPPWVTGWEAARAFRGSLNLTPTDPVPDDLLLEPSMRALADQGLIAAGRGPVVVTTRSMSELSRRFVGGRALFHAAAAPPGCPFLLTSAASERQAAGRAFAAELLVPREGLVELGATGSEAEDISRFADHFRASDLIVRHQLENQIVGA